MHVRQCRFSHRVFSLLLCVHLSSSPVFFLFLRYRHSRIRRMVPGTRHLSFSTLVWGSFVFTKASLRVPFDLKVVLIPRRLHFLSILSLTPLTYGKWRNLGVVCSCSSVRVEEWGAWGRFLRVRFTICAGYPFAWKTCFRWFRSPISLVAWQTFLALVPRHLMMLDLILAWW